MKRFGLLMGLILVALLATACGGKSQQLQLDLPPLVLLPIRYSNVTDGRGRFREIFTAVRNERGEKDPEDSSSEKLLHRMANEPPGTGEPVHLGAPRARLRILVVPGLLCDAIAPWVMPFAHALARLEELGYKTGYLSVSGFASCSYNADLLREAFLELEPVPDEKILLVGYSKGAPDILEALVRHPEVRERVSAVLSVAGAIGGSPVADALPGFHRATFRNLPLIHGTHGDNGAVESLERQARQLWLDQHDLPRSIRYFSLGAFTTSDRIPPVLQPGYDDCAEIDARNDSQLLFYDQVIPGSTLLGFANGDHWAVAMPYEENMPVVAELLVTEHEYPRAVLLEAAVRFIEEQL